MKAVFVELKDIESAKKYFAANKWGVLGNPVVKMIDGAEVPFLDEADVEAILKKFPKAKIVEYTWSGEHHQNNYKELLRGRIPIDLFEELPTSFDMLGDIIILEIPESLIPYENDIGEALLSVQKNIKTVLKKAGQHQGEFRTQPLSYLAGEKTKEANYKENRISLVLDVESVYFSPRLSTERKRIANQIKQGENVLVMFSGSAPYPCVISKNTDARNVVGVEKNPIAHDYAVKNIKKNKLTNVEVYNGDVRDIVPTLVPQIGLKCNISDVAISTRTVHNPPIIEVYLAPGDLEQRFSKVESAIRKIRESVREIYLHMPHEYKGKPCSFDDENLENTIDMLKQLDNLYFSGEVNGVIVHPQMIANDMHQLIRNLKKAEDRLPLLHEFSLWENLMSPPFSTAENINLIAAETGMKAMCFDIAHAFNVVKDMDALVGMIDGINLPKYFHIVDTQIVSKGGEEALGIGQGLIDFSKVSRFIKKGIIEVCSKDEQKGIEMIESYYAYQRYADTQRFDRVLMPLPKGAESFLDLALDAAKQGSTINFYDFEHESELNFGEKKVLDACNRKRRRCKILKTVKCGQYSPGKFRICVDFTAGSFIFP